MQRVEARVLFVIEIIEYERGWGQRPEGYLAFLNESSADNYIADEYKGRTSEAPSVYLNYQKIGYKDASSEAILSVKTAENKRIYIDNISQLL
jgi:hypothetical protein